MEEIKNKSNFNLSIITINLNNKIGLQKTISSVVSQNAAFFEFIIIDGASTDGSVELITQYQKAVSYWISEPDNGIYQAMNKGIRAAKGDYVLFLNSGDYLIDKNVIRTVFEEYRKEDILYGISYISKNGEVIYTTPHPEKLSLKFFYSQTISHQATFIRRKLFEQYGYYREDLKIYSDFDFWIRTIVLKNCTTKKINIIVSDYNLEGISSKPGNNEIGKAEIRAVLSKHIPPTILVDYDTWSEEQKQMQVLLWVKSKKLLYKFLEVFHNLASTIFSIKKRIRVYSGKKPK